MTTSFQHFLTPKKKLAGYLQRLAIPLLQEEMFACAIWKLKSTNSFALKKEREKRKKKKPRRLYNGITAVITKTLASTTFFSYSKVKFRWTSIKCVHHDTPALLAAVEFVMERFDWRPWKFYFRKWKNAVVERGSDDCCKGQIRHTESQTNCCITVKRLNWEYLARIQKRKKKPHLLIYELSLTPLFFVLEKKTMCK